ncbi:MAG: hypothetical protein AAFQ82_13170 [Myxococcota bacterium]
MSEASQEEGTGLPGVFASWPALYALVIAHLLVWIVFFVWLTGLFA